MEDVKKLADIEKSRRYRARHPEKTKASNKRWRDANPEKVKARNKKLSETRDKAAHREYMREWRKNNPNYAKNADLKKSYGITLAEYNAKLESQGGVCAVCGDGPGTRALAVDHNHETGEIRDILCHKCNTALGLMRECKHRLASLIEYTKKWNFS